MALQSRRPPDQAAWRKVFSDFMKSAFRRRTAQASTGQAANLEISCFRDEGKTV
jgi:hypothetical protein